MGFVEPRAKRRRQENAFHVPGKIRAPKVFLTHRILRNILRKFICKSREYGGNPLNSEPKLCYLINDLIEASTDDVNMHPTLYVCKRSELITSQNCCSLYSATRNGTRVFLDGKRNKRRFRWTGTSLCVHLPLTRIITANWIS